MSVWDDFPIVEEAPSEQANPWDKYPVAEKGENGINPWDKFPVAGESAPAKERPFINFSDVGSALGDVWEGVKQTPSAIRAGMAGFKNPRLYTPEEVAANVERTKFSQDIAQRQAEREASGESSSVGNAIRGAAQSTPFTLTNAAAMGATELASRAVGAGVGALAGPEAIPAGSQIGSSVGRLLRFGASSAAGYAAANASAGQMFLNDTLSEIKTRFEQQTGRNMSEDEQDEAYKEVLPLAEEYGKAEAGPEVVGNLAQLWGGKYLLGLGKHAVEGIAKRIGAFGLGQLAEHGGETYTGSEQHNSEERKNALLESRAVDPENLRTGLPGYVESFKEQAPTTMALSALGLGAGAAYKGIKAAATVAIPQQPVTTNGAPVSGEPIPVQVDGQTIAFVPPGSDLAPEDVAGFAGEPDMLKALARAGKITLPEVVAPLPGVDPTITQQMNDNVAAGAALAPATVEALKQTQTQEKQLFDEVLTAQAKISQDKEIRLKQMRAQEELAAAREAEARQQAFDALKGTPPVEEGAARNAEVIRQAAARMAGTEKGPDLGFAPQVSPVTTATEPDIKTWTPAVNAPATITAPNGQRVVVTVQSMAGNKASVSYPWNGKTVTQSVPVSQLGSPVKSITNPPRYIYTQEQNTRKAGKHIPTTPGVHENFDFRKAFASMAEDRSLSRMYQEIARILSKMPQFTNMDLHIVADRRRPYAGEYSHSNGRSAIAVNLRQVARGKVDALGTLLHEALHHVTVAKVRNPQGDVELDAVHAINQIRLKLSKLPGAERFNYELGTNEEFITGVFTHPGFQEFLAALPADFAPHTHAGKFRSLLSETFRLIAQLVTGKHVAKDSTLDQSMASILALFETPHRNLDVGPLKKLGPVRSLAGENAELPTFMRDSLDTAKAMAAAGKSSAEIRAVTGWFPGKYDNKMRWEIPDQNAKIKGTTLANLGTKEAKLGKVLDHPELFAAYPDAANIGVVLSDQPGGSFSAPLNQITLNSGDAKQASAKTFETKEGDSEFVKSLNTAANNANNSALSVLLHEVQHWIQSKEGFANGGTPTQTSRYNNIAGEIEARDVQARQKFTPEQRAAIEPYSSENIAPEDAIVMYGDARPQASTNYRSPADMLADTAAKLRGEVSEKPAGLNSMFNPKEKRPATGERTLFETPKKSAESKPIDLATAYQKARKPGSSTAWVPIKDVYAQAKEADPSLTPEAFMAQINEQNDAGGIMVGLVENVPTVEAARPFVVGGAGVEMLVPETPGSLAENNVTPEQDAEYMAAVESGDVAKQQAMVDAAAKAAGGESAFHGTWNDNLTDTFPPNSYFSVDKSTADTYKAPRASQVKTTNKELINRHSKSNPRTLRVFLMDLQPLVLPDKFSYDRSKPVGVNNASEEKEFLQLLGGDSNALASAMKKEWTGLWADVTPESAASSLLRYLGAFDPSRSRNGMTSLITGGINETANAHFVNVAKALGFDSIKFNDYAVADAKTGFDSLNHKVGAYVVFNPNQIKSADPITRDAEGNVIPLSARFNPASNSTLYSLAKEQSPPGVIDIGGEAEPADGKGKQLYKKKPTAIGKTYLEPADVTLQEKRAQKETLDAARKIIGESVAADGPIKGRRAALDRFRLDTSIPPEVRAVGTGLIAQQADILANLEKGDQQLLLDEMTDEAAKLSGVIASDPDSFQNLKADANLDIDKIAEEAARTLNILNVLRRLTPEGFLRRMTRKYNDAVREKVEQNFDVPANEVENEIARLWRMMQEAGATKRGEAIAAALKAFMPRMVNTKKIIEALFPQAGFRDRMNKGGEALVRNFFQMMAGPRDGKGPLAEFDETIQGALSSMLRKVMEAQGLVAKNASNQMTDIDKMVRAVSGDELRFDKIAAADAAMQKELAGIKDPERRAVLQQAWEEATSKMYTNVASDATVRRALNAELKAMGVNWSKMFDANQKPAAIRAQVVDATMGKIEALLTDPKDPTVQRNLGMLREEVGAAFDFIADNKHTQWLAQREAVEARRRIAEHRAAFMEALRNQGVAESALNRISEKLAGPQRGKPDQNPVSALVGEHMKEEVADFVDKLVALDVDRTTAEKLDKAANTLRSEIAAAEKLKAADRAVAQLMKSLKPKPRAPREKIEKSLKALLTADTVGALDNQAFFDAFGEAFNLPPLSSEQQTKIKKLIREVNAMPKGPARLDKQQELDEELGLWKGIAARDVLLSAWYANILSGVSTQGMGVFGNSINLFLRSAFNALGNPRSAAAYFKGAFGEGLATGIKEAQAAMAGKGLYKVSKYGDKNLINALELLRKKGPSTLPEWVAYVASAGTRLRYVFRIMQAIDAVAWNTAREGQAYLAAHRALLEQEKETGQKRSPEEFYRAMAESLGGDTAQIEEDLRAARQTLIDAGQTPDLLTVDRMAREARNARRAAVGIKGANRFADRIVLQQEPEGSGKFISSLIDVFQKKGDLLGIPFGQLLIPFNKIVSNLFEQSLDYTPVGALRSYLGGHLSDVKPGSLLNGKVEFKEGAQLFDPMERRERAMAATAGMAAAAIAYALAHTHKDEPDEDVPFMVYGWGPESKTKRSQMPKGWVPYSVKMGDQYIKFSEMPFGMLFAAAGSAMDAVRYKNMDKKTSAQRLAYVLKTSVKGFMNQGVLSSLDTAMESLMFQASDKKLADIPVNAVKGLVPAQGLLRDISSIFDPNKVSNESLTSALLRDIPFAKGLATKPDLNVFGEPVKLDGYPITRRLVTHREPHAVADYLGRNDLHIPGMEHTVEIGKYLPKQMQDRIQKRAVELGAMENGLFTAEQNYAFKKRAGELTKVAVQDIMSNTPKITGDAQRKQVQSLIDKRVENARKRAMLEAVPAK